MLKAIAMIDKHWVEKKARFRKKERVVGIRIEQQHHWLQITICLAIIMLHALIGVWMSIGDITGGHRSRAIRYFI